ncbi:MAG: orotidine-5'-phosphate decarboxylase [Planctomycetota bacterium]
MSCAALDLLRASCARTGAMLSVGLEPDIARLPSGFSRDLDGCERMLGVVIDATHAHAAAFKFNLAFFEAFGADGWAMLQRVRRTIPKDVLVIADGKRGDIGTTAERYAEAIFGRDGLDAHAATVNPLMGRDAIEPFTAHADRLTYLLALTSNAGASDFLIDGTPPLFESITARAADSWNSRGNVGIVVGATRGQTIARVREVGGDLPWLVPGVGAQGGDLAQVVSLGGLTNDASSCGLLVHVTRGVLPTTNDTGDPAEAIERRAKSWAEALQGALAAGEEAA